MARNTIADVREKVDICIGASEFLKVLQGFEAGRRL